LFISAIVNQRPQGEDEVVSEARSYWLLVPVQQGFLLAEFFIVEILPQGSGLN
jgi:hypothetical protein